MDLAPWSQLTGETDGSFRAFLRYIELPPHQRSIRNATAADLGYPVPYDPKAHTDAQRRKHGTAHRQREKWSSQNSWGERAKQWDEEQSRLRRLRVGTEIETMQDRQADIGRYLQNKALEAADRVDTAGLAKEGTPASRPRGFLRTDLAILKAFDLGCRIERQAYGLDTSRDQLVSDEALEDGPATVREAAMKSPNVAALLAQTAVAIRQADREAKPNP